MYAVKPKGNVKAAATEAEGNNVCVAISCVEYISVCDAYTLGNGSRWPCNRQVALQRVATPLSYTLTGQARSGNGSLHGRVHRSSART